MSLDGPLFSSVPIWSGGVSSEKDGSKTSEFLGSSITSSEGTLPSVGS